MTDAQRDAIKAYNQKKYDIIREYPDPLVDEKTSFTAKSRKWLYTALKVFFYFVLSAILIISIDSSFICLRNHVFDPNIPVSEVYSFNLQKSESSYLPCTSISECTYVIKRIVIVALADITLRILYSIDDIFEMCPDIHPQPSMCLR